ncbi:uncharacterized protein CELE_D1014.13 [Caenorhabditis elegans]|uniref:Uncharacterized protein n=1 Tax=Caenorhabditis elegans TaxID=6239 RepID=A0A2X0RE13_CAEEL|nr:Uncharacterized protein CELE_D1014.13 [Caenorhabditis elegans]SPS41587.1 Uncharacterized protein CELE_D1014.13 [Caenorhabditis elegans]|eukprot:NP_001350993.1 Uncharacterized protein CELE_D1014.13 [Caenorhabditis elegans]
MEEMRIVEIETADRKIKRNWSYVKKNELKFESAEKAKPSPVVCIKGNDESEINLLEKKTSSISKYSSPLAHRMKQERIDKREKLHLN